MDRNTLTGLLLIAVILIGFSFYMQPSELELQQLQRQEDSIRASKAQQASQSPANQIADSTNHLVTPIAAGIAADTTSAFGRAATGTEEFITIENEKLKAKISTKGARIYSVELKEYKTWSKQPLVLFDGAQNEFGLSFYTGNKLINTNDYYFRRMGESFSVSQSDSNAVTFRLAVNADQYIDFVYSLKGDDYMLGFEVRSIGMDNVIAPNTSYYDLNWKIDALKNEKDMKAERQNTSVYYQFTNKDLESLDPTKDKVQKMESAVKWVSFKQHFFSSSLIANNAFENGEAQTTTDMNSSVVKTMQTNVGIPFGRKPAESFGMHFYFGPNHFNTLKAYNLGLERQINLGWGFLKYINRYAVIPVFNFLNGFNMNYGLIILILTILLKLVLSPLTYRSYLSAAKMRLLKPEMDEIKAKLGEDDQAKLQQEYLKLYKRAGVNPLGGCVPLLLQMPILFAFFFFFPSSIELRQQSFLWVQDLSTYDSIWTFGKVPFISFIYGDHVSLMCLLMTTSTIIYTRLNNQISGATGQMKWMGYIMPVMFMGILNSVSAGLNYYYFCANMITFGQQYLIRRFVNEEKLHKQLQDNKKKPEGAKKSKFQQKLEDMQRQRETQLRNTKKK
jgi:YidC/Oxa1 family membrane protein insertase